MSEENDTPVDPPAAGERVSVPEGMESVLPEDAPREKMGFPPFTRIALIEAKDLSDEKAKGAIPGFHTEIKKYNKWLKISSPTAAIISRLQRYYRYQILIKSSRQTDPGGKILREAILNSSVEFNRKSRYKDVRLIYDVDPQSVI